MTESVTYEYVAGRQRRGAAGAAPATTRWHGETMRLNMGPQHPATHGVLRLMRSSSTARPCASVDADVGYLHRGKEKTCESLGWHKFFPHTDRLDYVQPLMNNVAYALAIEKLAGIEAPPRAQVVRVLLMELSRIMAHLIYFGTLGIDLGAVTLFFYSFNQRERALQDPRRLHRPPDEQHVRPDRRCVLRHRRRVASKLDHPVSSWTTSPTTSSRDELDGRAQPHLDRPQPRRRRSITAEQAKAWSLTGPNLRGSGVDWDLRRAQPYCGYETYDFDVPTGSVGDCYDRFLVRVEEMRQSAKIARQALDRLKDVKGDVLLEDRRFVLPPKGDVHYHDKTRVRLVCKHIRL